MQIEPQISFRNVARNDGLDEGAWDGLETGQGVTFEEEQGDKGPQAAVVYPIF